jgi:hypothetical protein
MGTLISTCFQLERRTNNSYLAVPVDSSLHEQCRNCHSLDLDTIYTDFFHVHVCKGCKLKYPEKYSLLTKTEVRQVTKFV